MTANQDRLREALAGLFELIESGELVRDISRDGQSDWHMRMIDFTLKLKNAQEVLAAVSEVAGGELQIRLEEAKRIRENWNVDESIRSFAKWIDHHISEMERLLAAQRADAPPINAVYEASTGEGFDFQRRADAPVPCICGTVFSVHGPCLAAKHQAFKLSTEVEKGFGSHPAYAEYRKRADASPINAAYEAPTVEGYFQLDHQPLKDLGRIVPPVEIKQEGGDWYVYNAGYKITGAFPSHGAAVEWIARFRPLPDAPVPASVTDASHGAQRDAATPPSAKEVQGETRSIPETGVPDAPVQAGAQPLEIARDIIAAFQEQVEGVDIPDANAIEDAEEIIVRILERAGPAASDGAGALRAKVGEWHKTCSDFENQHSQESTHYGSSSDLAAHFHRGSKEAFSRVLNELDAARAALPSPQPDAYHKHLDTCKQCANAPFNLCSIGRRLLLEAAALPSGEGQK